MSTDITIGTPDSILSGFNTYEASVTVMSATQALLTYCKTSDASVYVRVLDIAGSTVTHVGSELKISFGSSNFPYLVRLTDTKALLTYIAGSPKNAIATIVEISGSSVSNGSYYLQDAATASSAHGFRLADDKAVLVWRTAANTKAAVATISGTGITYGTIFTFTVGFTPQGEALSSTAGLVTFQDTTPHAVVLSISGTTITSGSEVEIDAAGTGQAAIAVLSDTQAIVVYEASTDDLFATVLNISGTTVSPGTPLLVATDVYSSGDYQSITATPIPDTENIFVAWKDFADADKTKAVIVSELGTVVGTVVTITSTDGGGRKLSALSNASALLVYDEISTGPLYAVVLETDPPPEPEDPPVPVPLPMLTVSMLGGATLQASLPMLTARLSGISPRPNTLDVELPALTASMLGGAQLTAELPMLTAEMSGTTTIVMTLDVQLPMIQVSMSGTSAGTGSIVVKLPAMQGAMLGGGTLAAELPMIQATMTGLTGSSGTMNVTLPMITAEMSATLAVAGIIDAVLPMLVAGPFGRIVSILPMMQATLSGRTVVAVTYEAYAVNLSPVGKQKVRPVTRYTNRPFSGMVRWQGNLYGWGPGGLYLIGGDDDDGEPIPWAWHTAVTNFGSRQMKVVRETFIHGRLGATVSASVSIGEAADVTYAAVIERGRNAQAHRVKYGRGLKAEYWSFGLADVTGSAMEVDSMQHEPQPTSRKI